MTTLHVAILGLDRMGTSFGLALKRYAAANKNYDFHIVGYDNSSFHEKSAQKSGAIDRAEKSPALAVRDRQIVLLNLPYDEVRSVLRDLPRDLREGVVILDASPVKSPSYRWAEQSFQEDHHIIGFTPVVNPRYLEQAGNSADDASADYFESSLTLIVPTSDALKEAIDLACNLALLIGSKPRFVDPHDFDRLASQVEQMPRLLGVALFYHVMQSESWRDMQFFTNPAFGVLTRTLSQDHADALRDQFMENRTVLASSLDQMIVTLSEVRDALLTSDRASLEALLEASSRRHEEWLTARARNDWDRDVELPDASGSGMMGMIFGDALAKRLKGGKK